MRLPKQSRPVRADNATNLARQEPAGVFLSSSCECKRGTVTVDKCGGRYTATCYGENGNRCKCKKKKEEEKKEEKD